MATERCDLTDLPVDQCACRIHKNLKSAEEEAQESYDNFNPVRMFLNGQA